MGGFKKIASKCGWMQMSKKSGGKAGRVRVGLIMCI